MCPRPFARVTRLALSVALIASGVLAVSTGTAHAISDSVYSDLGVVDLGGPGAQSVAVDSSRNKIVAVSRRFPAPDSVSIVDGSTHAITPVTGIAPGANAWDVAVDSFGGYAYVANANAGNVSVIDETSASVVGSINVGAGPLALAGDFANGLLYIANSLDDTVSVVDLSLPSVVATITVGDRPDAIAVNTTTRKIYVANGTDDTVSIIDGVTNTVTSTVDVGTSPSSIAIDEPHHRAYVVSSIDQAVTIIDTDADSALADPITSPGVTAVAVNPNGGTGYGTVILAGQGLRILDLQFPLGQQGVTLPASQSASDVAVNSQTGRIYSVYRGGGGNGFIDVVTPVNLPGAPENVHATASDGRATVTFAPPLDNGGLPAQYYVVTVHDQGTGETRTVNVGASPATVFGLTNTHSYVFSVQALNLAGLGPSSAQSAPVIPVAPFAITTTSLPGARGGATYVQQITATGGLAPYTYAVTAGALPVGLTLNQTSGYITGTARGAFGTSSFTVTATDAQFTALTSTAALSIQVGALPTVLLTSNNNPAYYKPTGNLTVVVGANGSKLGTPTGSVTFTLAADFNGTQTITRPVTAGKATLPLAALSPNTYTVTATYSGDANYISTVSPSMTQQIRYGVTTLTLTSTATPAAFGQSGTITATVKAQAPSTGTPTGAVLFIIDDNDYVEVPLAGTKATIKLSTLGIGTHKVEAYYESDGNYDYSETVTLIQVVNPISSTVTVVTSANPVVSGQSGSITATVKNVAPGVGVPTGTVVFTVNGTPRPAVAITTAGKATLLLASLPVGPNQIVATYSGDAIHTGTNAAPLTEVVNQAGTTTTVKSSKNPAKAGVAVTFTATVKNVSPATGAPTGTVTFMVDGLAQPVVALLPTGLATFVSSALTVGPHVISVSYSGDANHAVSSSANLTQTTTA